MTSRERLVLCDSEREHFFFQDPQIGLKALTLINV
jgi:hypothetical protein